MNRTVKSNTVIARTVNSKIPFPVLVPPGKNCLVNDVCDGDSVCTDGVCECRQHEMIDNNICIPKPRGFNIIIIPTRHSQNILSFQPTLDLYALEITFVMGVLFVPMAYANVLNMK